MDSVTRFCSQCGARVKALSSVFESPQKCPSCKATVLFWDLTRDPLGPFAEATKIKPLLTPSMIAMIAIITLLYVLIVIVLLMMGLIGLPIVLTLLALGVAGYGIAILLGQQYKLTLLKRSFDTLAASIERARLQQIEVGKKFYLLQHNYKEIVESETSRLVEARIRYEVKDLELEQEYQQHKATCNNTVKAMAEKLLDETEKFLIAKLTTQNFALSRDRFMKTVDFCAKVGYDVPKTDVKNFLERLQTDFKEAVRKQLAKEEQARIKEKMREELKVEQEIERELKRAELERELIATKLAEALAKSAGETSEQIEDLKRRLAEAESKQRSISMAQQTKVGNVYVISNIGCFGESVFKIGMTRRLDPMDRVRELGDASVPFPFDVHMMIKCENAPTLENSLHKRFTKRRLNKVNFRKEFFRASIEEIREAVEELHGQVEYVASPEALQFHESITMSDEEFAVIDKVIGDAPEYFDD